MPGEHASELHTTRMGAGTTKSAVPRMRPPRLVPRRRGRQPLPLPADAERAPEHGQAVWRFRRIPAPDERQHRPDAADTTASVARDIAGLRADGPAARRSGEHDQARHLRGADGTRRRELDAAGYRLVARAV